MALPNIFNKDVAEGVISRIQQLTGASQPKWGKMSVAQMLAHCCVTYEYIYEPEKYKRPKGMLKLMLRMLVKSVVVSERPYKPSNPTAPDFRITDERDFNKEQSRLIAFIRRVQADGESAFANRESHSFGRLSVTEWNNMFYKHLDHHLRQFGV
ncbi:hypothetical protein GCM10023093_15390 [Nemorincola caseinilytica]|uniref:DUF1569 domain-containing protein n=1 Tax=Nemorincola caseinilytica TaxID=2054315 RepID=A0ABP8NBU0_9BACT